jgi:serine/threonine protein kinase
MPFDLSRRYLVHEVLGRGGFGTVYRADLVADPGFTKPVALKVLHSRVAAHTGHLARLRDEARILAMLRHRSLVAVDALVQLDGHWVVVMEYIPGVSFYELRRARGSLPARVVMRSIAEVAAALDAAFHGVTEGGRPLRLIHRDVKSSNVLLTAEAEVKLLDFGVARADFDAREAMSQQIIFGSAPYLAPERLEHVDSHAGDVFALGVTACELLAGRSPGAVAAKPESHAARLEALLEPVEALGQPELLQLLTQMLAYDATDRPDAATVARRAQALADALPGPSLRVWAADMVEMVRSQRGTSEGDLCGRVLVEESTPVVLPDQFGDPFTGSDRDVDTFPFTVELPPPRPSTPRPNPWPVLGLGALLSGLLVAAAVLVSCAGVGAWAWSGIRHQAVMNMVREIDTQLDSVPANDAVEQARLVTRRARIAAAAERIGLVHSNVLLLQVQDTTKDGAFDQNDLAEFQAVADRLLEDGG